MDTNFNNTTEQQDGEKKVEESQKKDKTSLKFKLESLLGAILIAIMLPLLIVNITLIVKSYTNSDSVPNVNGYLPLIVLTDSMYPDIQSGDLIICHTVDTKDLKVGDTIAFFDPAGNGTTIVTHNIVEIIESNGNLQFRTQGVANTIADAELVPEANIVGTYIRRIPGAGNVALFLQTSTGLIVCVLVPMLLLVLYDVARKKQIDKKKDEDTQALLKELEQLKAEKNKGSN